MKKQLLKSMLLLCALVVGSANVWADPDYTYTLANGDFTGSGASKASGGITWTVTYDATTNTVGWDNNKGVKFGASNSAYPTSVTFTSSSISEKISKIVVEASGNSGVTTKLDVTVGSTTYGTQQSLSATSTPYEFEPTTAVNGVVTIAFSSCNKPTYIKKIEIYYEGNTPQCATPTFSPAAGTFYASQNVEISCSTEGATIHYTTDGSNPTTSSSTYSSAISVSSTTTIKAIAVKSSYENSDIATATYTIKSPIAGYAIDFEEAPVAYTDWVMTNIEQGSTTITGHGGSTYYGTTGGKATASIQTKEKIAHPGIFTCYVSKTSSNTTSSTWKVQVSSDGETWTDAKSQSATDMSAGEWSEITIDLAGHTDVYVRLYYTGSTALRTVDDIELLEDDGKQDCGLAYPASSFKVAKGYSSFPTPTLTNPNGVNVSYSTNNAEVATVNTTSGAITIGSTVGTATITATFAGNSTYRAGTATYTITTYDPTANDGSEAKPYTVTEALALINTLGTASSSSIYVKGIVSTGLSNIVNDPSNSYDGTATYYISSDGTTSNQLMLYRGYNLGKTKFTAESDLTVGDEVTVYGTVKMFNSTPEFNSNNYITQYKHASDPEVKSLEVKAAEYRTYVASANLIVPTGVKAYIATGETSNTLTLKSVAKIKVGTPVILNATEGYYSFEITDETVTYPETNLLKISDGTTTNGVFVLAKNSTEVGFYKWMGGALSPGKVYVDAPAGAREFLGFVFDDEDTTGINQIANESLKVDGQFFDLQGRKVANPTKGLYIVNGKKVVIK